jgi:redox-sensing transcriptional repressor
MYLREHEAFRAAYRDTISSMELGKTLGLSHAQVRKDLGYFGQFGHPGVGYRVPELIGRLRRILGTDEVSKVMLVGVGNLGRALLSFGGFLQRGFQVVAAFDMDSAKIGLRFNGPPPFYVRPMSQMPATTREQQIRLAILAVPASAAQAVAEQVVQAGIGGILNFAPVALRVDDQVAVTSVDLAVHLEQLSFQLNGVSD